MCFNNSDCNDGSHCVQGTCQNCISCGTLLFRKGSDCITDLKDCGECLEGYEEMPLTHYSSIIRPCTSVKDTQKCFEKFNCPPNKYCHNNSCVECFNCSLFNRLDPQSGCAKEFDDCGACFKGYKEVYTSTLNNSKPCEINWCYIPEVRSHQMSLNTYVLVFGSFISLAVILLIYWLKHVTKKSKDNTQSTLAKISASSDSNAYYPSAPTLSESDFPIESTFFYDQTSPRKISPEKESLIIPMACENKQLAKVYQVPTAPYYLNPGGDEEETLPLYINLNENIGDIANYNNINNNLNNIINNNNNNNEAESIDITDGIRNSINELRNAESNETNEEIEEVEEFTTGNDENACQNSSS